MKEGMEGGKGMGVVGMGEYGGRSGGGAYWLIRENTINVEYDREVLISFFLFNKIIVILILKKLIFLQKKYLGLLYCNKIINSRVLERRESDRNLSYSFTEKSDDVLSPEEAQQALQKVHDLLIGA